MLRVHAPAAPGASSASSLLLETHLGAPILQLGAGRFAPAAPLALALAVLHPLRLVVYALGQAEGDAPDSISLRRLYEHAFPPHFSGCNMAWGAFGGSGSEARDFIAVQSMDGQVAVFEQAAPGFVCALDGVLVPGPLAYLPRSDTLVTTSSDCQVLGWRYTALGAASSRHGGTGDAGTGDGGAVRAGWSVNIGESASWVLVGRPGGGSAGGGGTGDAAGGGGGDSGASGSGGSSTTGGQGAADLVVVADHSLCVVKDPGAGGAFATNIAAGLTAAATMAALGTAATAAIAGNPLRTFKRLDYYPAAACLYPCAGESGAPRILPVGVVGTVMSGDGAASAALASVAGGAGATAPLHNILVATPSGHLRVYARGGEVLSWAARLPFVPVAVGVGRFGGVPGLVVVLSARGDVAACYLGTDPPSGALTGSEAVREVDVAAEHRALAARIRDLHAAAAARDRGDAVADAPLAPQGARAGSGAAVSLGSPQPQRRGASLRVSVPAVADSLLSRGSESDVSADDWEPDNAFPDAEHEGDGGLSAESASSAAPTITVSATLRFDPADGESRAPLRASVSIVTPPWVRMPRSARHFVVPGDVSPGVDVPLRLPFRAARCGMPGDLTARVVVVLHSCDDGSGSDEPAAGARVVSSSFSLPLTLAGAPIAPVKVATSKLTIDTNRPPVPLSVLFADVLAAPHPPHVLAPDVASRVAATAAGVLSLGYWCGGDASVLVSKTSGRYRLQGGSLEALAPLAGELVARLSRHWGGAAPTGDVDGPFTLSFVDPTPVGDVVAAIDAHLAARRVLAGAVAALASRAAEVRLCIKRLLTRLRDKAPVPLGALSALLEAALSHALAAARDVASAQGVEAAAGCRLGALVALLHSLLLARFPALARAPVAVAALRAALPPIVPAVGAGSAEGVAAAGAAPGVGGTQPAWEEAAEAALAALLRCGAPPFAPPSAAAVAAPVKAPLALSGYFPIPPPEGGDARAMPESSARLARLFAVLEQRLASA